jgi:triosephosphate isomerase
MNLIQDLKLKPSTRILIRCDLNLPQDESGNFTDLFRLESSLPTIQFLVDTGATIFITSHLGSPKGSVDPKLSLEPLAELISIAIDEKVDFVSNPFDQSLNLNSQTGVFLLENLRFWKGEEEASSEFAQDLIKSVGAELFVQDAFGVSHRSHASLIKFPELLPSAAGLLLQKEVQYLDIEESNHLSLIVGGAKVESKLPAIYNFIDKASSVLTGGVVANTLLKASDTNIGASLFSQENLSSAKSTIKESHNSKTKLVLPRDYLTAKSPTALLGEECTSKDISSSQMILDLGDESIAEYCSLLNSADVIIWAGTLGFAENIVFEKGSREVLHHITELKKVNKSLKIIIGGGDTVDFVRSALNEEELSLIDHLSTGGGASLLMLAGQKLPALEALENCESKSSAKTNSTSRLNEGGNSGNTLSTPSKLNSKSTILVANLKSHFNLTEAKQWLEEVLAYETLTSSQIKFSIATPTLFIEEFSEHLAESKLKSKIEIISQDISSFKEGSNTGEVSATMLSGIAKGAIIGHSERRFKLGSSNESNQVIFQKVIRAIDAKLNVFLCVGSKSEDPNTHAQEVNEQLLSALKPLNSQEANSIHIAYEPVFAIGSGKVPENKFLTEQLGHIKNSLLDLGLDLKVLYGGSVNESNVSNILNLGFDGVLVGTASLKADSLQKIATNMLSLI